MTETKITIGEISIELLYAVGTYEVKSLQAINLNPFDKVICGLLARHKHCLTRKELGCLMGLNVVDDPTNWKYADKSECQILDDAIGSLLAYQMIESDSNGNIFLTQTGERSLSEGKKYKRSKETKTIYFDVFYGKDNLAATAFPKLTKRMTETEADEVSVGLIDDKRVCDSFIALYPELIDNEKGNSIESIDTLSLKIYKVEAPFEISFDFSSSSYDVISSDNIKELDDMTEDSQFCHTILAKFFSNTKKAVIYKPKNQLDYENKAKVGKELDCFVCGKREFFPHLFNHINDDTLGLCLYLKDLDDALFKLIANFVKKNDTTILCVEYISGDERLNQKCYESLGFLQKKELTVPHLCVCSNDIYYKEELFVFSFNGKDYQIPVIVKYMEKLFRFPVLVQPFIGLMIEGLIASFAEIVEHDNNYVDVDGVTKTFQRYNFLSNIISSSPDVEENLRSRIREIWQNYLNNVTLSLSEEADSIQMSNFPLVQSENFIKKADIIRSIFDATGYEIINVIDKIKSKLPREPKIVKRNAYIIDTSVFIDNPRLLNDFDLTSDIVFVPKRIREELDTISHEDSSRGKQAKTAGSNIDRFYTVRPFFLRIESISKEEMDHYLPFGWDASKADNHMLALALKLKESNDIKKITILVRDRTFEYKAILEGIEVRREL